MHQYWKYLKIMSPHSRPLDVNLTYALTLFTTFFIILKINVIIAKKYITT